MRKQVKAHQGENTLCSIRRYDLLNEGLLSISAWLKKFEVLRTMEIAGLPSFT